MLITKDANDDIEEIVSYIVNELKNPIAAKNLLRKFESYFDMISTNQTDFLYLSGDMPRQAKNSLPK